MLTQIYLALFLTVVSPAMLAAGGAQTTEVEGVIRQFHQALERHDVAAIQALVSPDVVVLENGHRNDGWADFRDNHLIPEFKEPAAPSKWEFVKVATGSEMAWAYTKETISATGKEGKPVGVFGLVRLRPSEGRACLEGGSLLNWSLRRLNDAN